MIEDNAPNYVDRVENGPTHELDAALMAGAGDLRLIKHKSNKKDAEKTAPFYLELKSGLVP